MLDDKEIKTGRLSSPQSKFKILTLSHAQCTLITIGFIKCVISKHFVVVIVVVVNTEIFPAVE